MANLELDENLKKMQRRFDTIEAGGWMMWNIDDLLYGYLKLRATYNKEKKELYFTEKMWNKTTTKREVDGLCKFKKKRDRDAHFNKLIDSGLIKVIMKDEEKKIIDRYVFTDDPDPKATYKLVPLDLLQYLLNTANNSVIQIYIYLLDKYEWKKKTGEEYYFTRKEIAMALGYSESTAGKGNITTKISHIIGCLARQGIIQFEQVTAVTFYNKTPTVRQKLTFVAKSIDELVPVEVK